MSFQIHHLSNGIRIVHKQTSSPVAHCGIIVNVGSRDEDESEQGIAHFIEHVIFKGTKKRKAFHILSRMEDVGGELNAYTTKEETCVYTSFMPCYYERSLELLKDVFFDAVFPKKEIEKEKTVVLDEINAYKDNPSEQIFDDFEEQVFDNHTLGNNILGKPKLVQSFNKKKIEAFINKNYSTQEIVICSVGNISFDKLIKTIEKHFDSICRKSGTTHRKKYLNYSPTFKEKKHNGYQTHCILGNIAFSASDQQKTSLILLNNLLGGPGMNSRLNLGIREKYGFTYSVESHYIPYSDNGIISIYLATDNNKIEKSIKLVKNELNKLCNTKLGPQQLKRSKQQLIGQIAIGQESDVNLMLAMGKSILLYNKIDSFEIVKNKIEQITDIELVEIAQKVFDPNQLSTLLFKI